ncbi:hypothetical protein AAG906_008529 [Vitis piasezkii]
MDSLVRTSSSRSTPEEGPEESFLVRPRSARRPALTVGAARAIRHRWVRGDPVPNPRANPFPEVTDPFCRLPLPTLFHRLRLFTLETDAVMSTTGVGALCPPDFQGPSRVHRTPSGVRCSSTAGPYLRMSRFGGRVALKRHPFSGLVDSARAIGHRNPTSGSSFIADSTYQNGPLGALDSVARLNGATYLKFENRSRRCAPMPLIIGFTR